MSVTQRLKLALFLLRSCLDELLPVTAENHTIALIFGHISAAHDVLSGAIRVIDFVTREAQEGLPSVKPPAKKDPDDGGGGSIPPLLN